MKQLTIMSVDERFAVARTSTHLFEFERGKSGSWSIRSNLPLAQDWIAGSSSGFSTYVDEERLRRAYLAYLALTEQHGVEGSVISEKSPLLGNVQPRVNILGEVVAYAGSPAGIHSQGDNAGRFGVHCRGSDGRYAFFIVTGISAGHQFDDMCFNVEEYPRLVVFRADNGKDWKVYDEGVIPNRGTQGDE